ncbi:DnaD domain-containing protein [Sporosarcina pasteurii]|uniref:DNA replication protein dnaD n=1 Tax=Sporosarcina pasteurii TaxID=1474 RepID=A0A380BMQ6_SPOPA|nr:DnaD domain-containing protein [Sporosarcina pasteurii]MDS9470849.1 DnaD domain-containing protein [Sporosarcina pasteurii]QBQ05484.1 DnaD domain protein [Sporosarcina pasteurii]SUJ02889.1 DNA replication protein dnaD [Sporosarcina pasteurii]
MQPDERLHLWIEQGSVNISQLFFHNYKQLQIEDLDAMLIMQMTAFRAEGNLFPTPKDFANRMHLTENEVTVILQRLMQRGFLQIVQSRDEQGVLHEVFSLSPLWNRLTDKKILVKEEEEEQEDKIEEGELFKLFEQEFGRFLSPMETESISMWLDEDGHSTDIIRAALREAVIAQKVSLRYIDRILFEWKKKNVKSMADVERQAKKFRTTGVRPSEQEKTVRVKRVPFYNWLEERE